MDRIKNYIHYKNKTTFIKTMTKINLGQTIKEF